MYDDFHIYIFFYHKYRSEERVCVGENDSMRCARIFDAACYFNYSKPPQTTKGAVTYAIFGRFIMGISNFEVALCAGLVVGAYAENIDDGFVFSENASSGKFKVVSLILCEYWFE